MNDIIKRSWIAAGLLTTLLTPTAALAGEWLWPLYVRAEQAGQIVAGQPRPAVWGTMGEFQEYGSLTYGHPGHDIRGDAGDTVLMPETGTVEHVYFDHADCDDTNTNSCRMWFLDEAGENLFYMSHVDTRPDPTSGDILEVSMEVRNAIHAATVAGSPAAERLLPRGTKLAPLTHFSSDWHHLHLGIFNVADGYQMQNTIEFLNTDAEGQTGESLLAVDDEAPIIASVSLVNDDSAPNPGADAVTTGACGPQISGPVDIAADIYDTYYTDGTFAPFPGKGVLDPNTGIRRAFFEVKNSSGTIVDSGTWYDIVGLPLTCTAPGADMALVADRAAKYGCLDAGTELTTSLPDFFTRLENENGAPSAGLSVLHKLFDVARSTSHYTVVGGETYIHLLTNENGQDGQFNPAGLPNGRYQFTVIAEDFTGRRASRTVFANIVQPGTSLSPSAPGLSDVYTRDRVADLGSVPSNPGGEPFWQSPDIFVLPAGSPEPSIDAIAASTVVVEDGDYDIYLRVTNPTCNDVTLTGVRIVSADPSAINTTWDRVTPGDGYHPDPDSGNVVSANSSRFFGPYSWKPTTGQTGSDGHRCLLAAFDSSADPVGNFFDAPNHNNVAQRNMSINGCSFELPNNNADPVSYDLRITTDGVVSGNDDIELVLPHIQLWYDLWVALPEVSMATDGTTMRARLNTQDLTLPAPGLLGGAVIPLSFVFTLPKGTPLRTASLEPVLGGATLGGMSCSAAGPPDVK